MSAFLKTDLLGKINNLPDFKTEALLPVFEAVANAIQAIEECNCSSGKIIVHIHRMTGNSLPSLESDDDARIVRFVIEDDGIGFNDLNFESFKTAETTHKLEKGGKGVGRFFWLKAFDRVEIESVYQTENCRMLRKILFSPGDGILETENIPTELPQRTIVNLIGFKEEYRKQPSAYKTTSKIAQRVLEHCLSYFIAGTPPSIIVEDDEEPYKLQELFAEIKTNIQTEPLAIDGEDFSVSHVRLYSTHSEMHNLVLCANCRDVKRINLSRMLGTSIQFDDEDRKFVYAAYITGSYLDRHLDASRTGFSIPEDSSDGIIEAYPVTMDRLKQQVSTLSRTYLKPFLDAVTDRKKDIVAQHTGEKNPALRAVPHYCPEVYDEIEPNSSEEKIQDVLYKYKGRSEQRIQERGRELLKTQAKSIDEIRKEFDEVTKQLGDFQKDNLAGYVVLRKMIIDLLDKNLKLNTAGKYTNEDIVHDIIFPRKATTAELDYTEHNLWLIDELLTFHEFAISERRACEFTSSESMERPDIVAFAEIGEDRVARCVSIVELKKPQRTKFDEDPTRQLYRYVRILKDNKTIMPNGRTITTSSTTRFYCYAICDITAPIREFADNNNYAELQGDFGFYLYNRVYNAHTMIVAFDKIVLDAKRRHKAFFDKLGIPW